MNVCPNNDPLDLFMLKQRGWHSGSRPRGAESWWFVSVQERVMSVISCERQYEGFHMSKIFVLLYTVHVSAYDVRYEQNCWERRLKMPWGAGGNLGPPVTPPGAGALLHLQAGAQLCCTGHLPARGQICPQPHAHTHTFTCAEKKRRLKQCEKKRTLSNVCSHVFVSHTHRSFAVICLFKCLFVCFVGGTSSSSVTEGSCGLRKILSVHLWEGEKSNQIKSIVSSNNKPRSHTQQSLTPLTHTIAKYPERKKYVWGIIYEVAT